MSDPRSQSFAPHLRPSYACLYLPPGLPAGHSPRLPPGPPPASHDVDRTACLADLAQDFSPRFECHSVDLISIDVSGLARLLGDPHTIGEELRRSATARGLRVQIAVAATRTAAMVLAHARPGLTVVQPGGEAAALAPIPVGILQNIHGDGAQSSVSALKRWGVKTLGALAALPATELAARLGQPGLVWQTFARGQDVRPLVPTLPEERFESSMELEWPIEGLEPLSFVLTRLLEPLSTRLERRDRGAAALHLTLGLVTCHDDQHTLDTYSRSLQLPSSMRDVRTLRTLLLLDLDSHPPPAAVERVTLLIDPTPGRVLQHTLFTRAHPTPEQLSTLIARLSALMGQDRIGRPAIVDSYRPGAFEMEPFKTEHPHVAHASLQHSAASASSESSAVNIMSALRRCRHPVPARVTIADGRPVAVTSDRHGFAGGHVLACAGPWRTSGHWWEQSSVVSHQSSGLPGLSMVGRPSSPYWNRDEWDVSLGDGAVYRIFRDRVTDGWFIDAIVD
jgi:protein ImuB